MLKIRLAVSLDILDKQNKKNSVNGFQKKWLLGKRDNPPYSRRAQSQFTCF